MTEKVLKLLAAMGADTSQEELLTPLCQAVQDSLARRLRPGVTAEDCESAFVTAAAWMVLAGGGAADGPLCGGRRLLCPGGEGMMEREWSALLERYGQRVVLHRGERETAGKAFLQPIRETGQEQQVPSPLGFRREDRLLYLGVPDCPLGQEDWVEWNGGAYEVWSTHPVHAGQEVLYTWAVLRPRDLEAEAAL